MAEDWESSHEGRYTHADYRFLGELEQDVNQAEKLLASKYVIVQNFAKRTLVRSVFAEIEGRCASIQGWAIYNLGYGGRYKNKYSEEEVAILTGRYWQLDDGGQPRRRKLTPQTRATIKFSLKLLGKGVHPPLPTIDYAHKGWTDLCAAIEIRDRLTHPKKLEDVFVTDPEIRTVLRAHAWFSKTCRDRENAVAAYGLRRALRRRRGTRTLKK